MTSFQWLVGLGIGVVWLAMTYWLDRIFTRLGHILNVLADIKDRLPPPTYTRPF